MLVHRAEQSPGIRSYVTTTAISAVGTLGPGTCLILKGPRVSAFREGAADWSTYGLLAKNAKSLQEPGLEQHGG